MTRVPFSVDAKLLRELGERLVGRAYIALAELVKNAYDADASTVVITVRENEIEVIDDGHGMSPAEFTDYWMRIGTTHKEAEGVTRNLRRPMTGSKGVGRLAAQLLASELELTSRVVGAGSDLLVAVDWTTAVEAGLLNEATADMREVPKGIWWSSERPCGTRLVLRDLNQQWSATEFALLAREIWPLQPPFRTAGRTRGDFTVTLRSADEAAETAFRDQMDAILRLWTARIQVRMLPSADETVSQDVYLVTRPRPDSAATEGADSGEAALDSLPLPPGDDAGATRIMALHLETVDGDAKTIHYRLENCHLFDLNFEVRVFTLQRRQPYGISVETARKYLRQFGGVHVYDAGFHLPYYGVQSDWLGIEQDHSHRLSSSKLLPAELQGGAGMRYLPTNSRLFGVVNLNTTEEARRARDLGVRPERDALRISVTRDRLAETAAYNDLVLIVRWALDYYAFQEASRAYREAVVQSETKTTARPTDSVQELRATVDHFRDVMSSEAHKELADRVAATERAVVAEQAMSTARAGLLGSLATAGISALAYEHEVGKQFDVLERSATRLERLTADQTLPRSARSELQSVSESLRTWMLRAKGTRALFNPLLDPDNRAAHGRFPARRLVRDVARQVQGLARGSVIDTAGVAEGLLLPAGGYPEWAALFQNLLVNALNAMLDSERRLLHVSSVEDGHYRTVLVQDTGVGIDLTRAEAFFEPFIRQDVTGRDRTNLALGGSGLGLTIVRMLAADLAVRCRS